MKRRRSRRQALTDQQKWMAQRYRAHRSYSARQLREILVEDAVGRFATPIEWFTVAVHLIAMAEHTTDEVVFQSIRAACIDGCGRDLPLAGAI